MFFLPKSSSSVVTPLNKMNNHFCRPSGITHDYNGDHGQNFKIA